MADVRAIVIDALDRAAGLRSNPSFAQSLIEGRDIALADLDIDSLARFEVLMAIEDHLGLELDDDAMTGHLTLAALIAHLESELACRVSS